MRSPTALAIVAALTLASFAQAQAQRSDLTTPYNLAASAPQQVHIIPELIETQTKALKDLGIDIYGHIAAGYTWNMSNPSTRQNAFRSFDFEHDEFTLDQIDLSIERRVDYKKNKFDVGFLMEWMYGADAGLIHANGIFDWYDGVRNPENQFDPVQFYVDVTLPVFNGVRLRMGKFVNLVGYESINPTVDFIGFYSRSYVFGSGYPFTHLGALATFSISKDVEITAGITRGDEQGFEDNNGSVSFLGALRWNINPKMQLFIANSTGPEQANDSSHYRTTWDASFYWMPTDRCKFLLNAYFLWDGAGDPTGESGYLYSLAALGSYQLCKEAALKLRAEFFHDEDGLRAPAGTNLYEVTVGLDIVPFAKDKYGQGLILRPELRWDFSDDKVFDGQNHQCTLGIDVIYKF